MTLAPCVALAVSVLFFGMRLLKREAADTLLALVAAKRHYVRYIRCAFLTAWTSCFESHPGT